MRFTSKYDEDFEEHLEYFVEMCNDNNVPEYDRIYFFQFSLRHGSLQHYKRIVDIKSRLEDVCHNCCSRYAPDTKKEQISSRLRSLTINYWRNYAGDDDHVPLYALLERINSLIPMAKDKDRDKESLIFLKGGRIRHVVGDTGYRAPRKRPFVSITRRCPKVVSDRSWE